eukprot:TRINITY_DN4152_c0_g1_i2.p1 TRINITY_DN4152_c0_g1~~TRINITY_DN4152_c0_g1_i2.p1  ORF type:complete len:626 (+),score=111.22 TRINITY_DN4152_c0_g1_i2:503-2380(+)
MLNNWLLKNKQDEYIIGTEIIEEIKNDLQYVENDNPLAHLNQVVSTQPSRQTKNSTVFAPFNPKNSMLRQSKKASIIQEAGTKKPAQPTGKMQQSIIAGRSLSKMFSLVGKKPDVAVHTDLDFQTLDAIVNTNKRLGKEKEFALFFKEARKSEMRLLAELSVDYDIKKNLIQLIGFLIAQLHIANVYEFLCTPEYLEGMWHELLIKLEQNMDDYWRTCKTAQEIVCLKFCITWFVVATYRIGFSSQNTLIDTLLKNSGVYIQKIVEKIEAAVWTSMEKENYSPIVVNDVLDYEKYVEKYGLQIENLSHDYPSYLPYTILVVNTNIEIKTGISEIFNYLRFICTDDSYVKLVYNATDSMIMSVLQLYRKLLGTDETHKTMCQIAQMHNNISYFQKSLDYFEKYIGALSKSDVTSYQFSSLAIFTQLKNDHEEAISKQIEKKLDYFLGLFEGIDWKVKVVPKGHHVYIEEMVNWLKNNLASMEILSKTLAVESYLNSLQYVCIKMLQIIVESPKAQKINQISLYQVYLDLEFIKKHMAMVTSISPNDIDISTRGLSQTLNLLLMNDISEYFDPTIRNAKYIAVKGINLVAILNKLQEASAELPAGCQKIKKAGVKAFLAKIKELDLV